MDGCSDLPTGVQARLFTQSTLRYVGVCVCLGVRCKLPNLVLQNNTHKHKQTNVKAVFLSHFTSLPHSREEVMLKELVKMF